MTTYTLDEFNEQCVERRLTSVSDTLSLLHAHASEYATFIQLSVGDTCILMRGDDRVLRVAAERNQETEGLHMRYTVSTSDSLDQLDTATDNDVVVVWLESVRRIAYEFLFASDSMVYLEGLRRVQGCPST